MSAHHADGDLGDLGERRLVQSRARLVLALAGSLAFLALAAGLWAMGERVFSVLTAVVFGAFGVMGAVQFVRPPTLWLDAQGFTYRRPPFGTQRETWAEVGPFSVWTLTGQAMVTYEGPAFTREQRTYARLNRAVGARSAALHPGLGGLSAQELCLLLNRYRETYGGHAAPSAGWTSPTDRPG